MRTCLHRSAGLAALLLCLQAFPAAALDSKANTVAAQAEKEMVAAADARAAIATQLVLNIVEPQSSGIGGGALLLFWNAASGDVTALDGREKAPAAAKPDRFMKADGTPQDWPNAYPGGLSVGVPGTPRVLEAAHKKWGKLPWAALFQPAIVLAENGFELSPRLNKALTTEAATLLKNERVKALYFTAEGQPKPAGTLIKNPAFAATLRLLSEKGADAFYTGANADDIVATVTQATPAGDMTLADLKAYEAKERSVVCGPYHAYKICGFGPPTSGGIAVVQILGLLEGKDMASQKGTAQAVHLYTEAARLAFADRNAYVADSDFVDVPVNALTDKAYLQTRAQLIGEKSLGVAPAGQPGKQTFYRPAAPGIEHGTSHISIIDAQGNAVAMTTTIEYRFGAQIMTKGGYMLNNQLTDFSFKPDEAGKPVANRLEANKRPRSSMAPTLVFDKNNKLWAVVGSPGGPRIIHSVSKTIIGMVDWGLDPQQAINLGNFGSQNSAVTELEAGTDSALFQTELEKKGHTIKLMDPSSGLNVLQIKDGRIFGGSDYRQEGAALGL